MLLIIDVNSELRLTQDWHDDMTDDTYAEMFRSQGEARDVDYNRNREMIARHFGMTVAA